MRTTRRVALLVALMLTITGVASAASVEPSVIEGSSNTNKTCTAVMGPGYTEFKIEPVPDGTYYASDGMLGVDIVKPSTLAGSSNSFDWTSNGPVLGVIVKDGVDGANFYDYRPGGSTGDTYLTTPFDGDKGISHISFCYIPQLTIGKTANATYTRTWNWTIDKSVTPDEWDLFTGDSGTSLYTVAVTKTGYTDSAWAVGGWISIANPWLAEATITGVTDELSPYGPVAVDCGVTFPYALPAGETLYCTYSAAVGAAVNQTNTATVTTTGAIGGGTATANATFGAPTTVVNGTINVTDTYAGSLGSFSDSGTVTYSRIFECDDDEGTHNNTATITETGQSDSASVEVACYALEVDKQANPFYSRYWNWTIDKVGDQTDLILSLGQQFLVNYDVTVGATYIDDDFGVTGYIDVYNPAPMAAEITDIADVISLLGEVDIIGAVDCGELVTFPYSLASEGTLSCIYSAELPDDSTRLNTATATLQNYDYDKDGVGTASGTTDFTDTASVDFSEATMADEIDECIDVEDDQYGFLGKVCAADLIDGSYTFEYSMYVGPYEVCGEYQFVNVASFETNDTATTGSDSWTVWIDVPCLEGCTLTPGYWKTHSEFGPAPYDDNWANLPNGASTPFFPPKNSQTWYQVLWTAPSGGNVYYILAHAYIAAYLNILNGASSTPEVDAALAWAEVFFNGNTPTEAGKLKGAARTVAITYAYLLDQFNNGYLGPGHCSE